MRTSTNLTVMICRQTSFYTVRLKNLAHLLFSETVPSWEAICHFIYSHFLSSKSLHKHYWLPFKFNILCSRKLFCWESLISTQFIQFTTEGNYWKNKNMTQIHVLFKGSEGQKSVGRKHDWLIKIQWHLTPDQLKGLKPLQTTNTAASDPKTARLNRATHIFTPGLQPALSCLVREAGGWGGAHVQDSMLHLAQVEINKAYMWVALEAGCDIL